MEIITFDHKVYQDLNDKIERIADYVFRKETNPRQEPEIWLTSEELADLLKSVPAHSSGCARNTPFPLPCCEASACIGFPI